MLRQTPSLTFYSLNSLLFYYSYTLSESMASKLNWLLQNASPGSLVLQSWLTRDDVPHLSGFSIRAKSLVNKTAGWRYCARRTRTPRTGGDALWCPSTNQLEAPVHLGLGRLLQLSGRAVPLPLQLKQQKTNAGLALRTKRYCRKWFKEYTAVEWLMVSALKLLTWMKNTELSLRLKGKELPPARQNWLPMSCCSSP